MADQFRWCDELVGLADLPHAASEAAETQGCKTRSQGHHREVGDADAIARSCETEKEEGTEIGRDQREKQHTGLKPTIR